MKIKEYNIKIQSISRFIIGFLIVFLPLVLVTIEFLGFIQNEFISIILFVIHFSIGLYLAYIIGLGKGIIYLSNEGIAFKWKRSFFLGSKKDIYIPWNMVDNYVFQPDRSFDSFIINLNNKTRFKMNRINFLPIKDDFYSFVKEFPRSSNNFKTANSEITGKKNTPIKKGESIYESKYFKWILYAMSIGFSFLLVGKLNNPSSGTSWSALGVIGFAILFYSLMIFKNKK